MRRESDVTSQDVDVRFRVERGDFGLDIDLWLSGHGITALFGHSVSGKTTCLRATAGLDRASGGRLAINDDVWQDVMRGIFVPTHWRALGYVFLESGFFCICQYGATWRLGKDRDEGAARKMRRRLTATSILPAFLISSALPRYSTACPPVWSAASGRVSPLPARCSSRLLLMDELLAALDLEHKQEFLPYLERLHDELSILAIYVSHSPDEVARLADYLVLVEGGRVVASRPLGETLVRTDLPPAFTDDAGAVLEPTVSGQEAVPLPQLDSAGACIHVRQRSEAIGSRLRGRIHASDVGLALVRLRVPSILNIVLASISAVAASAATSARGAS